MPCTLHTHVQPLITHICVLSYITLWYVFNAAGHAVILRAILEATSGMQGGGATEVTHGCVRIDVV